MLSIIYAVVIIIKGVTTFTYGIIHTCFLLLENTLTGVTALLDACTCMYVCIVCMYLFMSFINTYQTYMLYT